MFKMKDNVKSLIESKMTELAKKQKYVVIFLAFWSLKNIVLNLIFR